MGLRLRGEKLINLMPHERFFVKLEAGGKRGVILKLGFTLVITVRNMGIVGYEKESGHE